MPRPSQVRQREPNSRFLGNQPSVAEAQQSGRLFNLPVEIRLAIYRFSFARTHRLTLRRFEDLASRIPTTSISKALFTTSILATCKIVHAEALPVFYASHTFHYSAERDGVFHQPNIKQEYLQWVKHISIDATLTFRSYEKLEPAIVTHVQTLIEHCTRLSSFILHIIPSVASFSFEFGSPPPISPEYLPRCLNKGAAANTLRELRPRLRKLSIVSFGNWYTMHHLRKAITGDDQWAQEDMHYRWPGLSLSVSQDKAVSVKQRTYSVIGLEDSVHPHKQCIRVFNAYRPKKKRGRRSKKDEVIT